MGISSQERGFAKATAKKKNLRLKGHYQERKVGMRLEPNKKKEERSVLGARKKSESSSKRPV